MTAEEPWSADVLARYLTAGGAHIDLVEVTDAIEAICPACPTPQSNRHPFDQTAYEHGETRDWVKAVEAVAEWAQAHAATCRAVPRPATAEEE